MNKMMKNFLSPGPEFRGAPFWAWNAKLEPEELRRLFIPAAGPRLLFDSLDSLHIGPGQFGDQRRNHFDLFLLGPGHKLISFCHNSNVFQ